MSGEDHQILKFRPRTMAHAPGTADTSARAKSRFPSENELQNSPEPSVADEYRHRMTTNVAAILFAAVLTGIGIWLAVKIADLRSAQDCVLMGRRDCAHISSPGG